VPATDPMFSDHDIVAPLATSQEISRVAAQLAR